MANKDKKVVTVKKHIPPVNIKKNKEKYSIIDASLEPTIKNRPGPKPKEKDDTKKIYRHIGIPETIYHAMEDENTLEKRTTGNRINTEETLVDLISEGLEYRKKKREDAKK